MGTKKLPYQKPSISEKKIKISFFLTPKGFLDDFSLVGDVFAQTSSTGACGTGSGAGTAGGGTSCASTSATSATSCA